MANWDVTTAGSKLEFITTQSATNSPIKIDANHIINFWHTTDVTSGTFTQVFIVNTTTWAVTTANSSLRSDPNSLNGSVYNNGYGVGKIDDNHFILFYSGGGDDGFTQVFTVNTTTWAVTTSSTSLEYDTRTGIFESTAQIDSNHFINVWYGYQTDGFAQVFTVNTTTWAVTTAANSLEFDTQNGSDNSLFKIDDNHFIDFYLGGAATTDGSAQVFTVNTTSWEVTTSSSIFLFDTDVGTNSKCWQVDSNHFINFWTGSGGDGYVQTFTVNTTTWAVTTASSQLEFDTTDCTNQSCYKIDTNHFLNVWIRSSTTGLAQVFEVNTTTWAVTTTAATFSFETTATYDVGVCQVDTNHYAIFWNGVDSDGFAQVLNVEVPGGAASTKTQLNIGDTWKTVTAIKINIGDTWKSVTSMKINIGDTWKTIFTFLLSFIGLWKK